MIAIHNRTLRDAAFAGLALLGTVAGFGITTQPSHAAPGAWYTAALAAPVPAPRRVILDGVVWNCAGQTCVAAQDTSRDVTVCGRLARKVGPVATFTTPQGALGEEELARCNRN